MSKRAEPLFRRVLPLLELKVTKHGPQSDIVESNLCKVCIVSPQTLAMTGHDLTVLFTFDVA
jgi:hypothetical protein